MLKLQFTKRGKIVIAITILVIVLMVWGVSTFLVRRQISFVSTKPEIEIHTEFNARANIEAVRDGSIEDVQIDTSKINKDQLGQYAVIYTYNNKEYKVLVSVIDSQPPVFEVQNMEIDLGMTLDAKDFVTDIKDDTKTSVMFKEVYDFSKVGDIEVIVLVEDACGNKSEKASTLRIFEKDEVAPEIIGARDLVIRQGNQNVDFMKGVSAKDNRDPSPAIQVEAKSVNLDQLGEYEIMYTANDRSGNMTKRKHKVSVVETREIGTLEPSVEKIVYLTFDDGPSQSTIQVLDILEHYDVQATFFVTGLNPDYFYLIKEAKTKGHTIGMHTYSHNYAEIYASTDAYFMDLDRIAGLCEQQIGYVPKYIRFPGGASNTVSKRHCAGIMTALTQEVVSRGYQYYDWNVSSGDGGGTLPVEEIVSYSTESNANNVVLLLHDANGKQTSVDALPAIIEYYKGQGYRFEGIDDDSFAPHHPVNN